MLLKQAKKPGGRCKSDTMTRSDPGKKTQNDFSDLHSRTFSFGRRQITGKKITIT